MGMERLVLLLREQGVVADTAAVDVYVVAVGSAAECIALVTTERVREAQLRLRILQHTGGGSFKSQMKKADKSGARLALIWGEDEVAAQAVTVKPLRDGGGQRTVPLNELVTTLSAVFAPCD
jgi:histidyl-tRNA synthetase